MIERLQSQAATEYGGAPAGEQTVYVHAGGGSAILDRDSQVERFAWHPRHKIAAVYRAWRALVTMARARELAAIVLVRLYGAEPPGLLERLPQTERWTPEVDWEYRRVVGLTRDGREGIVALERALRIDERRREGEPDASRKARIATAKMARKEFLGKLGAECEALIVAAATAYRETVAGPERVSGEMGTT
jgi:hypothetical protein